MSEHDSVQKLLSLKKYETPGEDYFDQFLSDFHERQRTDILRKSSRSLFLERLSTWFSGFGREKWLLTGGITYAVVMLTLYLKPDEPETSPIRHPADSVHGKGSNSLQAMGIGMIPASSAAGTGTPVTNLSRPNSGPAPSANPGTSSPFIGLDELDFLPLESGTVREF